MAQTNIEQLVPGVAQIRAREGQNRALAFAGITRTVCGIEILSLTPRARLELQLLRNAFVFQGAEARAVDLFVFLWVLHPSRSHAPRGMGKLVDSFQQWALRRRVKRLDVARAAREVRVFIVEQLQDLPETHAGGSDYSPWVHWMAGEASWWISVHGGFSFEEYLRTSYLVLQQLFRGWKINNPEVSVSSNGQVVVEEPQFINASDSLVGQFHVEHRAAAAAAIRRNRFRVN